MTGRTGSARLVLRPQASSLPLGFFAFGMGTILLSAVELHWTALAQTRPLMIMVLVFVAPLELIAGLFPARDVGAATGLSLLGAAWVATALTVLRAAGRAQHGPGHLPAHDDGHHAGAVGGVTAGQAHVRAAPAGRRLPDWPTRSSDRAGGGRPPPALRLATDRT
ncbi:MAG: hypothetical protein ACRDPY_35155 [Streptosporangiaceae bacterium]